MKKRSLLLILCVLMTMTIFSTVCVNAESKKSKAYKEYQKILKDGFEASNGGDGTYKAKAYDFTLVDITGDGIKDLVVDSKEGKGKCYAIFAYSKTGVNLVYEDCVLMQNYYYNQSKHSICTYYKWNGRTDYTILNYDKKDNRFKWSDKAIKSVPKGYKKLVTNYKNTSVNRKKVFA